MLVYPLHSGTIIATQCHRHRDHLLAVAYSFSACCKSVASCLDNNQPIGTALLVRCR